MSEYSKDRFCSICHSDEPARVINLFTVGSEGTSVCQSCEMHIVTMIKVMQVVAGRTRRIGYTRGKHSYREGPNKGE